MIVLETCTENIIIPVCVRSVRIVNSLSFHSPVLVFLVSDSHEIFRSQKIMQFSCAGCAYIAIVSYLSTSLGAFFSCDQYNSICRTGAIDSCSRTVFQYFNGFDVIRVKKRKPFLSRFFHRRYHRWRSACHLR